MTSCKRGCTHAPGQGATHEDTDFAPAADTYGGLRGHLFVLENRIMVQCTRSKARQRLALLHVYWTMRPSLWTTKRSGSPPQVTSMGANTKLCLRVLPPAYVPVWLSGGPAPASRACRLCMASTVYQWLCVEAQQAQVLLREAGAEVRARLLRLHGDGGRAVPLAAASIGVGMASRALSRNTSINLGPD